MASHIPPQLSRRALLKTGLVGTLLVGAGSAALLLRRTRQKAPRPLSVLDAEEYAILAALADRVCPALGDGAPGATALDVAGAIDKALMPIDEDTTSGVKIGLRLFESAFTGALFGERVTPFTQLSPAEQDQALEAWSTSSVKLRRTLHVALSTMITGTYWGMQETWTRIGYAGPPSPKGLREAYADNLVDLAALRHRPDSKDH